MIEFTNVLEKNIKLIEMSLKRYEQEKEKCKDGDSDVQ